MRIIPILVLGSARNGTTWLCNTLCLHPEIVGVQHELHWGIHESNLYVNELYWGNISQNTNYIKFVELYSSSDYFTIAEGDKNFFYENRFTSFIDFFFTLMDNYASMNNAKYWITKLDPSYFTHSKAMDNFFAKLEKRYKSYKIVGIKRDFKPVLQSYLYMEGRKRQHRTNFVIKRIAAFLEGVRYAVHYKSINEIIDSKNGLFITFDEFKNSHKKCIHEICEYLGLGYSSLMEKPKFPKNTSFNKKRVNKRKILTKFDYFITNFVVCIFFRYLSFLGKLILKMRQKTRGKVIPISWRLLQFRYMKSSFIKELENTGDFGLLRITKKFIEEGSAPDKF